MAEKIVKKVIIEVDDKGSLKKTGKDSQTLNRNMKGLSQQSSNASKNFSKQAQGMQGVLVPAYAEVAARVFALSAAYQALSRASDFRILMQGQAEYAKRTGKNMGEVAKQVQKAAKGMLGFADASSAVALATTSGIGSGQIVKMTKAAVDSSTALGRSVQDTMDRLTRGIVKAEPEILDEIGVIIRLDKVYKDYAESVSKSTQELSEGEKATARYNAIMGQLETKFGGISDKVDPNYMRAAAATTLDIVTRLSAQLTGIFNPVLKFLSETKSAVMVIIAVILKNIAGKVFPMFSTMGASIAAYPAKMAANVTLLSGQIDVMNAKMAANKVITKDFNSAINKAMPTKYRGAAWNTAGTGAAGQKTKLRSMGASLTRAEKQMGKGASITTGKYAGMTRAQLNVMKVEHKALQKEIGKTHTINQRFAAEGSLAVAKFNKTVAQTKMFFATAAASATQYFTTTKQLIADRGFIAGTAMAVRAVGMEWTKAATAATLYERNLKRVAATTAMLGVITAVLGKILSKAFAVIVALTMFISIGKMILDMFVDFDTPFKKAADAASDLNSELKEQKELFDSRDSVISMQGIANSFDEAMANSTFAANFAEKLSSSLRDSMKILSKDLDKMGFWDSLINGIKKIFDKDIVSNMSNAASQTALMVNEAYPEIAKQVRDKYKVSGSKIDRSTTLYKKEFKSFLEGMYGAGYTGIVTESMFEGSLKGDNLTKHQTGKTMVDYIDEIIKSTADPVKKQQKLAAITKEYSKLLDEQEEKERTRLNDLKALTDAMDALSKANKKFSESLLTKTGVHGMAVEFKKIKGIMGQNNLSKTEKFLALDAKGLIPDKFKAKNTRTGFNRGGDRFEDAYEVLMAAGGLTAIMEDFEALDKKLMESTTKRLRHEAELKDLQIFGNSALEEQVKKKQLIGELALVESRESLRLLKGNENATAHDIEQAELKVALKEKEINDLGKISLRQAEYRAKLEGRTLTIVEKIAALKSDYGDNPLYVGMAADDATAFYTKYMDTLDKSIKKQDKLNLLVANFSQMTSGQRRNIRAAQQKALQFSSFAGSGNTFLNHQIINDSMLKGIGENEYKRNRTAELISENPVLKMHKPVIDLYLKVEKLRAKNLDRDLLLQAEKQLIETEYKLALEAELDAKWKERADVFGGAMKTIADGFGSAISSHFNDIFMNKKLEKGAFRNAIAQSFANAGSKIIGDTVQQQVFGRSGIVSGMLKAGGMSDKWLNTLFPKTELELAQERTSLLKDMLVELEELNEKRKVTGSVYPGDPNNVVPEGLANLKALAEKSTYGFDKQGNFIGEGISLDTKQILTNKLVRQLQEESSGTTYGGKTHVWDKTSSFATFGKNLQNGHTPKANYNVRDEYGSGYYDRLVKRLSLADAGIGYAGKPSGPNKPAVVHDHQTFKAIKHWIGDVNYKVRDADMWGDPSFKRNKYNDNSAALAAIKEEQEAKEALKNLTESVDDNTHWTQQSAEGFTGWQSKVNDYYGGHSNWNTSMSNMLGGNQQSGFGKWGPGVGSFRPWAGGTTPTDKYGIGSMVGDLLLGMIFAKGGVAPGGFRAFAKGGIANRPTLGMVGEGGLNEAIVPLPDGRSIPVKGASGNVTVNVAVDANGQSGVTDVSGEGAKELGYLVSQAVQAELVDQQRPGGLLSSY